MNADNRKILMECLLKVWQRTGEEISDQIWEKIWESTNKQTRVDIINQIRSQLE
jgi:hypothetical protein